MCCQYPSGEEVLFLQHTHTHMRTHTHTHTHMHTHTHTAHTVRDITARYASGWCTHTRKHRLSGDWWSEVLQPYSPDKAECEQEEEDILSMLAPVMM